MLDLFPILVSHRGPQRPQLSPRPCACKPVSESSLLLIRPKRGTRGVLPRVSQSLTGHRQDRALRLLADSARPSFPSAILLPGVTLGQRRGWARGEGRGLTSAEGAETCLAQPPFCRWGSQGFEKGWDMPNVTNQVRLRTGLELKHPASKQAAFMSRQERPSQHPGGR